MMAKSSQKRSIARSFHVPANPYAQHSITLTIHCDLLEWNPEDRRTDRWPATLSSRTSPHDEMFPGLLVLTPHSRGGKKFCSTLKGGNVIHVSFVGNVCGARVVCKEKVPGTIFVYGQDVWFQLVPSSLRMAKDDAPKFACDD